MTWIILHDVDQKRLVLSVFSCNRGVASSTTARGHADATLNHAQVTEHMLEREYSGTMSPSGQPVRTVVRKVPAPHSATGSVATATGYARVSRAPSLLVNSGHGGTASSASTRAPAPPPRPFLAARELMQERAPPRRRTKRVGENLLTLQPRQRRSQKSLSIEGARLEHLVCCYNNDRFQGDLKVAEEHCEEQAKDLVDLHHIRGEEGVLLTQEARDLRKILGSVEDDILMCGGQAWSMLFPQMTASHSGLDDTEEDLQESRKQVDLSKIELAAVRRRVKQAQRDAVLHQARLSVTREIREMEVHEVREMLETGAEERNAEEGLLRRLAFEQFTSKELCKLSELEKLEHQKHVTSLYLQLQKARGAKEMEVMQDAAASVGNGASHEDVLQALQGPVETLVSFLEKEVGIQAGSTGEEGNGWTQELARRLDACSSDGDPDMGLSYRYFGCTAMSYQDCHCAARQHFRHGGSLNLHYPLCFLGVKLYWRACRGTLRLLKLRNPWGTGRKWVGKYSDSDTENWSAELKAEVGAEDLGAEGSETSTSTLGKPRTDSAHFGSFPRESRCSLKNRLLGLVLFHAESPVGLSMSKCCPGPGRLGRGKKNSYLACLCRLALTFAIRLTLERLQNGTIEDPNISHRSKSKEL
eukprot:4096157-Amphidinium_carterae.2